MDEVYDSCRALGHTLFTVQPTFTNDADIRNNLTLIAAVHIGHCDCAEALIKQGADANAISKNIEKQGGFRTTPGK